MNASKVAKGRTAVLRFALRLLDHGFQVYEPLHEDTPVDLVVGSGHHLYRVQVKSAQPLKGSPGRYEIPFRKITIGAGHVCKVYRYGKEHVDYLVGVVPDSDDFYCFPILDVEQFKAAIRVNPKGLPENRGTQRSRLIDPEPYRNAFNLFGRSPA